MQTSESDLQKISASQRVSFTDAWQYWFRLGWINFGGPAGQIAIMHRDLVDQKNWIGEQEFMRALQFCLLLPGPEAQQLATYLGWRLHGYRGGIIAGVLFVLPSVFVLFLLSWLVAAKSDDPNLIAVLQGVKPVIIALVLEAFLRIAKKTLNSWTLRLLAVLAFVAIYFIHLPFPLIVFSAALCGIVCQAFGITSFQLSFTTKSTTQKQQNFPPVSAIDLNQPTIALSPFALCAIFALLWLIPFGFVVFFFGLQDVLVQIIWFFTKAALVTFGGAYSVLSYIAEAAVHQFHWLSADQMLTGLALAESTPGPLIMVTQYVGFFAAWNHAGSRDPFIMGILGSCLTTYMTFLPCFLFIFLGAPHLEKWSSYPWVNSALKGISAAVAGVIANLALFFGEQVLFPPPHLALNWPAAVMALIAFVILKFTPIPSHWLILCGGLTTWVFQIL